MMTATTTPLSTVRLLELLLDELGERASVRQAWALLRVAFAESGGLDQRVLARALGTAAATRVVQALSEVGPRHDAQGNRGRGFGFIESHVDAHDLRLRRLTLTAAGRRFAARLQETAE